ncbi:uncharacterized protein [Salmo salar]|uniref:Uncharacterized protein n=1 Tax=Salmo salar TaxID=8030 RepID=A0A1S3L2K8_SALSA|nr:uncharacterized protein LOC106563597 [Salmo salar]|eukprot:XP_013984794.1 PREDICTED: uncharacterized protein LOC106563597 [Salmo salar]
MKRSEETSIPVKASIETMYDNEVDSEGEWHGEAGVYKGELDIGGVRSVTRLANMGVGGMASKKKGVSGHVDYELGKTQLDLGGELMVEGRLPSAGVAAGITNEGVKAMATAELLGASVSHGKATATMRLAADTGFGVGKDGIEAQFLGTGFSIGKKTSISLFGSKFEWDFSK